MFQVDMCTERQTFLHDGCLSRRTRSLQKDHPLYRPNAWGVYRLEYDEYVCLRPDGDETVYLHGGAFTTPFLLTNPGIDAVASYFGETVFGGLISRAASLRSGGAEAFYERIAEDKLGLYARLKAIQ